MVLVATRPDGMHGTDKTAAALSPSETPGPAMREAARRYVRDGEPLAAFLADIEVAHRVLDLPPPTTEIVKEASIAWADEFIGKLDGTACEDPLTGMSGPENARAYLTALARTDEQCPGRPASHAVVVVTLAESEGTAPTSSDLEAAFDRSLQLATVAETLRAVFERCDVVSALGPRRVLAVVGNDPLLRNRADELDWLLRRRLPVSSAPEVRVEQVPEDERQTNAFLEDLTP